MIYRMSPVKMMVAGFGLLLLGWLLPFMMVLDLLAATFVVVFVAYGAQVLGLVLGLLGAFMFSQSGTDG